MNKFTAICVASLSLSLAGCGGTMQGVVRGEGTPVQFTYEQGLDRDFYTAIVDGEQFSGQAVNAGASSGVGTVFTGTDVGTVLVNSTTGEFVAVLLGNRGSTMRCQMNYADSSGFTSLGGVGLCQHSDGRIIDVTW
ncbi:MAG: hypothetical protein AAGE38_11760 [Pseudomonadota bacterium]